MDEENKISSENVENTEENKSSGMNWLYIVVMLVLLLGVGYYFMNQKPKMVSEQTTTASEQPAATEKTSETPIEEEGVIMETAEENEDGTQSLTVEGGMFYFKPNKIVVKKNQPVVITFNNTEGMHDFVIDELDVKSEIIGADKTTTIEFIPTETGEFEFYCSVMDHRARGMVGTLIVE